MRSVYWMVMCQRMQMKSAPCILFNQSHLINYWEQRGGTDIFQRKCYPIQHIEWMLWIYIVKINTVAHPLYMKGVFAETQTSMRLLGMWHQMNVLICWVCKQATDWSLEGSLRSCKKRLLTWYHLRIKPRSTTVYNVYCIHCICIYIFFWIHFEAS